MNDKQLQLWTQLMTIFEKLANLKFEKGTVEHKGLITDMTYEQLEQAELEEIIDLVHYRMAKLLKRQNEKQT